MFGVGGGVQGNRYKKKQNLYIFCGKNIKYLLFYDPPFNEHMVRLTGAGAI